MITAHGLTANKPASHRMNAGSPLPPNTLWLDLAHPTPEEIAHVSQIARVRLPKLQDVRLLEQSRQAYVERNVTYLLLPTVTSHNGDLPGAGVLLVVFSPTLLITVHEDRSRTIDNLTANVQNATASFTSAESILLEFFEAMIARCADLSEVISHEMEQVSHIVFQESLQRSKAPGQGQSNSWRKVLMGLGRTARLNHKLRNTLAGLERVTDFLTRPNRNILTEAACSHLRPMTEDVRGLVRHVDYLVSESNFLLDAIVGAISIEQNNVIKIFSVVTIAIMPPTLVGAIYGMNFTHMPELGWVMGYPMALVLMLLSAIVPLWWFRRNGWF